MLDRNQTVASVVLDHSECAEVFQRHHIDFCCRGERSIEVAASERGVAVDALIADLSRAIAERRGEGRPDPRELSTAELVAHIVSTHHGYLRKALPFVKVLAAKVRAVHGDHNPKLRELDAAVGELVEALLPHLDEEEEELFPLLGATQHDRFRTKKLLDAMIVEHLVVARLLDRIRAASEEFSLPDWACNSYRTLLSELRRIEADVFTHVHLENHVLRPRFAGTVTA